MRSKFKRHFGTTYDNVQVGSMCTLTTPQNCQPNACVLVVALCLVRRRGRQGQDREVVHTLVVLQLDHGEEDHHLPEEAVPDGQQPRRLQLVSDGKRVNHCGGKWTAKGEMGRGVTGLISDLWAINRESWVFRHGYLPPLNKNWEQIEASNFLLKACAN